MEDQQNEKQAEIVEEEKTETSVAIPRRFPVTIYDLAALEETKGGVAVVEAVDRIVETLRRASIRQTMPDDWTLYRTPDGRVTGYLEDQGCKRITSLWGIGIYNLGPGDRSPHWEKIEDDTQEYAIRITGDAVCGRTGQQIFSLTGVRYSTDEYAQQKPAGIQRLMAVASAARANLDGNATRKLTGLEGVSVEELDSCWAGTWKKSLSCNFGRGFGTKAERMGAVVQQSDIAPEHQPHCATCTALMKYVAAGKTKDGRAYEAFWSCPSREHKSTLKHSDAILEAKRAAGQQEGKEWQSL